MNSMALHFKTSIPGDPFFKGGQGSGCRGRNCGRRRKPGSPKKPKNKPGALNRLGRMAVVGMNLGALAGTLAWSSTLRGPAAALGLAAVGLTAYETGGSIGRAVRNDELGALEATASAVNFALTRPQGSLSSASKITRALIASKPKAVASFFRSRRVAQRVTGREGNVISVRFGKGANT